jgi:hypothetical protein
MAICEVQTAINTNITVFWNMTPWSLVSSYKVLEKVLSITQAAKWLVK